MHSDHPRERTFGIGYIQIAGYKETGTALICNVPHCIAVALNAPILAQFEGQAVIGTRTESGPDFIPQLSAQHFPAGSIGRQDMHAE